MKLLKKVGNDEFVFVQLNDILFLINDAKENVPELIKKISETEIKKDSNKYRFIELKDESAINFIRDFEYIVDYSIYSKLSDESLYSKIAEITENCSKEKCLKKSLLQRHMIEDIVRVLCVKYDIIPL